MNQDVKSSINFADLTKSLSKEKYIELSNMIMNFLSFFTLADKPAIVVQLNTFTWIFFKSFSIILV